jgi:hypothetical protein
MGFNSETGSEAGKTSKRSKSLSIDLRSDLKTLITHILQNAKNISLACTRACTLNKKGNYISAIPFVTQTYNNSNFLESINTRIQVH